MANVMESSDLVRSYAKNDHLGLAVRYLWNGSRKRFILDFFVRLSSGKTLLLEIKGEDSPMNKAKRDALAMWVRGVNAKAGFGNWAPDVAFSPAAIPDILIRHSRVYAAT